MRFDSCIKVRGMFSSNFPQEVIKNEPIFFNCDLNFAYSNGGIITKHFLDCIPDDWQSCNPVIDSRVHMLMKGWYPCIPGWHHDDIPRSTDTGQPNYINPEYYSEHLLGLVNGEATSSTRFLLTGSEGIEVPDPNISKVVYADWDNFLQKHPLIKTNIIQVKDGQLVQFDWQSFHEGVPSIGNGWRWFIRLSRNTNRQKYITNEIRKQVQVYLSAPRAGW